MKRISNNIIVNNIRQLAKVKGMPIGNLEEKVGVSKGYFSRLEGSNKDMLLGIVVATANILNCTLDELVLTDIGRNLEIMELEARLQALKVGGQNE